MPSRRVPSPSDTNDWTRRLAARHEAGLPVADLTVTNPTKLGLSPLAEAAAALAAVWPEAYEPDPRGMPSARAAVAAALASRAPSVDPDRIVLTTSTSESYALLLKLLADPDDAVLFPAPSYPLLEPLARAEGVEGRAYRLAFDGAWHLDRDVFAKRARGAKAVVAVEPNHPTGSCLDEADRAFVEEIAEREGLAIVADEVFGDHPWPGLGPLPTWLDAPRRVPTFVLGGLSKLCGLPHLKLGWIVAAGPSSARDQALAGLEWLADLYLGVASPVQSALPALLELRRDFARLVSGRVGENLARFDALARERHELSRLAGDGGWSVVLRVPGVRPAEAWALALLDRGVAVHPGHFYDFERGEHLVASLLAAPADVDTGCAALAEELNAS
jgi:aspartate/methionine/tyrosine aminotransferase